MIYKILIKGQNGMQYAMQKVEIIEQKIENGQIVDVPTGKYTTKPFESEDKEKVKAKFIELLDNYKKDQLDVVADMKEIVKIEVEIIDPSEENEDVNDNENTEDTDNEENTEVPETPVEPSESEGEDADTV